MVIPSVPIKHLPPSVPSNLSYTFKHTSNTPATNLRRGDLERISGWTPSTSSSAHTNRGLNRFQAPAMSRFKCCQSRSWETTKHYLSRSLHTVLWPSGIHRRRCVRVSLYLVESGPLDHLFGHRGIISVPRTFIHGKLLFQHHHDNHLSTVQT